MRKEDYPSSTKEKLPAVRTWEHTSHPCLRGEACGRTWPAAQKCADLGADRFKRMPSPLESGDVRNPYPCCGAVSYHVATLLEDADRSQTTLDRFGTGFVWG